MPGSTGEFEGGRPELIRVPPRLQLNQLSETVDRAMGAFSRLLGEVNKAVGRYGAVQIENLAQMPIFPEAIRSLMGMLSRSPEALATQLNRMLPAHSRTREIAPGVRGWVDPNSVDDRGLLTQLAAEIDRVRQAAGGNGAQIGQFFSRLATAVGNDPSVTLATVVERARTIMTTTPTVTPSSTPSSAPNPNPTPAPTTPEGGALRDNEELAVGNKRTVTVAFDKDVSIDGQNGKLAASTVGSVTIAGLKISRERLNDDKVMVEVLSGAAAGQRRLKLGTETRILSIRASN